LNQGTIPPHGGKLVNNYVTAKDLSGMATFDVSRDVRTEVENIAQGIFSPLDGFLNEDDLQHVLREGRLTDGTAWTIPIVLDVDDQTARSMKDVKEVVLNCEGESFGIIYVKDIYRFNKVHLSTSVYGTTDSNHPGVKKVLRMKDILVSGKTEIFAVQDRLGTREYRMTPLETRKEIVRRKWNTVVGFQTRNVPHIAHEMVQKAALNIYDGLFINPLIGKKKTGDFTDELIVRSYDHLIRNYYQQEKVLFATLHTEMRYAGPREAIHHAIMRKNLGCTHFIVGRDHAGVGEFYPPFAAHDIFKDYPDLGIEPVFFPSFYYCRKCLAYANAKTCPHSHEFREELSGTMIRKMVNTGEIPDERLMRPEVSQLIISSDDPFVKE